MRRLVADGKGRWGASLWLWIAMAIVGLLICGYLVLDALAGTHGV
ncbi:MAG TPA: hypothetical protein VFE45_09480 [Coriobacteriia bacterium]|nr:hypothetical protein [Coriobacteriia bacterium]